MSDQGSRRHFSDALEAASRCPDRGRAGFSADHEPSVVWHRSPGLNAGRCCCADLRRVDQGDVRSQVALTVRYAWNRASDLEWGSDGKNRSGRVGSLEGRCGEVGRQARLTASASSAQFDHAWGDEPIRSGSPPLQPTRRSRLASIRILAKHRAYLRR